MVVAGNGDAHLKNWGLIYPDRRTPRLGPAYDLVATVARLPGDSLALALNGARDFGSVTLSSFEPLARAIEVSADEVRRWVTETAQRSRQVWLEQAAHLPFSMHERERIEAHLRRVPLLGTS